MALNFILNKQKIDRLPVLHNAGWHTTKTLAMSTVLNKN